MSEIRVTQEKVDEIYENTMFLENTVLDKVFLCIAQLPSGFTIVESSAHFSF
ncbi:hypothetical protein [Weizmannia acidilactici]|uniref:hypothetical protein n=1 Tax=Weizmannia acidilactici TaxID=2607726 RepID=UPI00126B3CCB|nr:hypothetical protein [Weizmannia acidilactici]GER68633.1 hypothetical protein BpJC4_31040 [Weizmannia acidilactici]GER75213.1 hypothetical protein BpPP18_32800 [Weizmannia acidilactici]